MGFVLGGGSRAPKSMLLTASVALFMVRTFGTISTPKLGCFIQLSSLYVANYDLGLSVTFRFCFLFRAMRHSPILWPSPLQNLQRMNGHSFLKCSLFPQIQHVSGFFGSGLLIGENFIFLFITVIVVPPFFLMVALDLIAFHSSSLGCLLATPLDTSLAAANIAGTSSPVYVAPYLIRIIAALGSETPPLSSDILTTSD